MSFSPDGQPDTAKAGQFEPEPSLSPEHVGWLRSLLAQSPASLNVTLQQTEHGVLQMEWQSVLQGAGTAYLSLDGQAIAACLLLQGRFGPAERAAADALQGTLHAAKSAGLREGFEAVRQTNSTPLRAVFLTRKLPAQDTGLIQYWADCLAAAFFPPAAASPEHQAPLAHSA